METTFNQALDSIVDEGNDLATIALLAIDTNEEKIYNLCKVELQALIDFIDDLHYQIVTGQKKMIQ